MIDFHVHQPAGDAYGPAAYADFVAALGVELSVTFTYDGLRKPGAAANDSLAAFVADGGKRFVAFANVDPNDPGAADEIRRCVREHGMRGVKLHPWIQGFSVHAPGLDPVCEAAAALGIPVIFHDGTPPYSAPLQLAALARRHPGTTIVLGHGGLHDLWREAWAAVESTDNVHICLCATPPYAMRELIAPVPAGADPLRHRRRPAPGAGPTLCRTPHPAARPARADRGAKARDPRGQPTPAAGCRMIVDVHSHVPSHRDRVPPEEYVENRLAARPAPSPRRRRGPSTRAAFARTSTSRSSFTIAARTGVDSTRELNDRSAAFVADDPDAPHRLPLRPPRGRRRARGARARHERPRAEGHQARPELPGSSTRCAPPALRDLRARRAPRAADPVPPGHVARSARRPCATRIRCSWTRSRSRFPELRIVMAHLGHPWQRDTIVTIRKHPHVYADVSAHFYRPWSFYEALRSRPSGAPSTSCCSAPTSRSPRPAETIAGLRRVNDRSRAPALPPIPQDAIEAIIHRDPLPLLGLEHPAGR